MLLMMPGKLISLVSVVAYVVLKLLSNILHKLRKLNGNHNEKILRCGDTCY